jgi:hypothetical protein
LPATATPDSSAPEYIQYRAVKTNSTDDKATHKAALTDWLRDQLFDRAPQMPVPVTIAPPEARSD